MKIDIKQARYDFTENVLNANDWAYKYAINLLNELEAAYKELEELRKK